MIATLSNGNLIGSTAAPAASPHLGKPSSAARIYDADLVRRFNAGERGVFTEIVERHRKRLVALAYSLLKNEADAEEIAQDALVRAYRGLGTFRGESSLGTWLRRITYNLSANRYGYDHRRRRHVTHSFDSPIHPQSTTTLGDLCICPAPDPAGHSESRELADCINRCMGLLRSDQREILTQRSVLENSYERIASTLGVRLGTVKSRIARARGFLRALIERESGSLQALDTSAPTAASLPS
ncbi:MAG: RNA polymerase sigma factor [Opitutaceae bacterium]|nr:RNA polymerase sigma factor [Opitutaceae bacterium]